MRHAMAFAHVAEGRAGNNKEPQGSEAAAL